jgi:RNA polymerase sigma-70 factor (ECF subfamily)
MEDQGSLTRWAHELYALDDPGRRDEAARQLWLRFAARLGGVVRRRLDPRIRHRADVDDVLQSLFASFAAAPGPGGPPRCRAELWQRLVRAAMSKVINTADCHRARKRDVFRERPLGGHATDGASPNRAHPEPEDRHWMGPEDEAVAHEEFARLRDGLPEDLRPVFDMKLQGYTNAEIAARLGRVERTVELKLQAIRGLLGPRLGMGPPATAEAKPKRAP